MILDTHHHFWSVDRGDYHWMPEPGHVLCRDYLPGDLSHDLRKAGVSRTILVQAAQTAAETDYLLDLAGQTDFVAGVIGWLDMASPEFPQALARRRRNPKFLGIRLMLQDLDDDKWILRPDVLRNLRHVAEAGVVFEILTFPRHLPHVVRALGQVPGLRAVVDHLSKPPINQGILEPWRGLIAQVARFPNVYCKLSGMVTEADHQRWTPSDLMPYANHVLDCFGPDRVIFGSDWPVCLQAASYAEVVTGMLASISGRSDLNLNKLLYRNGATFFQISSAD